jgi:glycosyltransferase involved in cell wall biosynthesis
MREVMKDHGRFKSWSKKLAAHNKEKFMQKNVQDNFLNFFFDLDKTNLVDIEKISFCISTNGKRKEKTLLSINSINRAASQTPDIKYEIIVCGIVDQLEDIKNITLIKEENAAKNGLLGKLRNTAAEKASGDVIVFIDDDIIFDKKWFSRLKEYNQTNDWYFLGNKILLPDGGRYWDRATIQPHTMVDYEHTDKDPSLYQTGCFWVIRKSEFLKHKWNETIPFEAYKYNMITEDVEYSRRLINNKYKLKFDKKNLVWHYDDSYYQFNNICYKKETIRQNLGIKFFEGYREEFKKILRELQ